MKMKAWRMLFAAFFLYTLVSGLAACSSQEQGQQQEALQQEGQEGYYEDGYEDQEEGNYSEEEGYQNEEGGNAYADSEAQDSQQQDELQDIIAGMNEGGGEADPYAGGDAYAAEGETYAAEGEGEMAPPAEPLPAEGEGESLAVPQMGTEVEQQQAAVGMAAAPGIPELGSKMSYVVQRGDTLASIATKIYGDMNKWREIAEFTGMANPNMIYPGDVVYYQLTDQTMAFASAYESMPKSEVVVQPGDTLSTISSRVLGSSQDWKLIWRQNDNIDNPDVLVVGQTLYYTNDSGMNTYAGSAGYAANEIPSTQTTIIADLEQPIELLNSIDNEIEADFAKLKNVKFKSVI